jgi:hypothetical protein
MPQSEKPWTWSLLTMPKAGFVLVDMVDFKVEML